MIPICLCLRCQLEPHLGSVFFSHKTVPAAEEFECLTKSTSVICSKPPNLFVHELFGLHVLFQNSGDCCPSASPVHCLARSALIVPLPSSIKGFQDRGLFDLCVGNPVTSFLAIPWVSFLWCPEQWWLCHRGGLPSRAETTLRPDGRWLKQLQPKAVTSPCDAHQRFCFSLVALAVTAILCESKLWL